MKRAAKSATWTHCERKPREIFAVLKVDAENGQFRSAIVSANEKPTGLILKNSKGDNFVYEKRADGQWHCLDDDKRK
jgi:hypothetical protein